MCKKLLISFFAISLIITGVFLLLNQPPEVKADSNDNVWGFAWAGIPQSSAPEKLGLGWISFNCNNSEFPNPHCTGNNDYGIHIENDGNLTGYAYYDMNDINTPQDEVGWIDFNPSGAYPICPANTCPTGSPNYSVRVDLGGAWNGDITKKPITGWARAVSYDGGWDGWILIGPIVKGGIDHGAYIDTDDGEFHGWAWGDDVMGWISFNCDNPESVCSNDYKVETSFSFSNPPQAENLQIIYHTCCNQGKEICKIGFDWVYRDGGGGNQTKFEFQVDDNAGFSSPGGVNGVEKIISGLNYPDGTHNSQQVYVVDPAVSDKITFRGNTSKKYYWRVKVYDESGNDSGWIEPSPKSFQTEPHAWPWPDFELDPDNPTVDETASTTNSSQCFNNSQDEIECGSSAWSWTIFDGSFVNGTSDTDKEPVVQFSKAGDNTLTLKVSDILGSCSKEKTFQIRLPLPIWIETSPN